MRTLTQSCGSGLRLTGSGIASRENPDPETHHQVRLDPNLLEKKSEIRSKIGFGSDQATQIRNPARGEARFLLFTHRVRVSDPELAEAGSDRHRS